MEARSVPVAVVAATRYELKSLRPSFRVSSRGLSGRAPWERGLLDGVEVIAAATGIGPESAAARLEELLEAVRPGVIVGTGFAGALDPDLAAGTIVIAEEIWELKAQFRPDAPAAAGPVWDADPRLLAAALEAGSPEDPGGAPPPVRSGRVVASPSVVSSPG